MICSQHSCKRVFARVEIQFFPPRLLATYHLLTLPTISMTTMLMPVFTSFAKWSAQSLVNVPRLDLYTPRINITKGKK